jgi:hypothetical protein
MNYTVTIGFSRNKMVVSKLIQLLTRSKVSHTYVKVSTPYHDPAYVVYQASGLAVNAENYDHFLTHAEVMRELEVSIPEEQHADAEAFLLRELGKSYSVGQLVGMLWVLMGRCVGLRLKNPWADGSHSYVCVEFAARLLGLEGSEEMTPQDLLDLLEKTHL